MGMYTGTYASRGKRALGNMKATRVNSPILTYLIKHLNTVIDSNDKIKHLSNKIPQASVIELTVNDSRKHKFNTMLLVICNPNHKCFITSHISSYSFCSILFTLLK